MKYLLFLTTLVVTASEELLYEFDWMNNIGPYL